MHYSSDVNTPFFLIDLDMWNCLRTGLKQLQACFEPEKLNTLQAKQAQFQTTKKVVRNQSEQASQSSTHI